MIRTIILLFFLIPCMLQAQNGPEKDWTYLPIDNNKQKWGDWDKPQWLRYFGLDAGDVDRDGNLDVLSGRYIYRNPGGTMTGDWKRISLDENVDGIFITDVDNDPFADIIAQALPGIYWYEAIDESGQYYRRSLIANVPATSHVNSQGFEKADILPGGQEELLIAGNGNVYCITIPQLLKEGEKWPTKLIGKNTSDEGIGVGDIDGDGDLDISCGRRAEGEDEPTILVWFENPGNIDSPWQDHPVGHTEHPIDRIEIADLNGDGKTDIVIAEERYPGKEPDGSLFWFSPTDNQEEEWTKHVIVTQYSSNNLDIGDVDQDGDIDIVTGEHKGEALELQLWENDGKGRFHKIVLDTGKENHLGTQLVDLDADGDLDIIGAGWDNYQWMHVWRNDRINSLAPGSIFREYTWKRGTEEREPYLRVGGRFDYQIYPEYFPETQHESGYVHLAEKLDLDKAIRAELIVERLKSHEGSKGLEIQLNENDWLPIREAPRIPDPAHAYLSHINARVAVPLAYLSEKALSFRFKIDPEHIWNWPQNLIYGLVLRIYYRDDKAPLSASVSGVEDNGMLSSEQELSIESNQVSQIKRVDYLGLYEEVNWQGDGLYRQWQFPIHKTQGSNHIGHALSAPFTISWDTQWLPDQHQDISVMARVETKSGLVYLTKAINGLTLNRDYSIELVKPYQQPAKWATRSGEFTESLWVSSQNMDISEAYVYWRSWSPCYAAGIELNGQSIIKGKKGPCYQYYEHTEKLKELGMLKQGKNQIKTLKTPLYDGKMVHGMEVQWPGIMLKVKTKRKKPSISIAEVTYENAPHFLVHTPSATYYFDKAGGGFSRIIDKNGNDWVSFKKEPWGQYPQSAASSFRGLPNMVFKGEDDGAGHPGHQKCKSWATGNQITTESLSGKWKWSWTFEEDHAILDILKTDPDRKFWFLYEGTPGGSYQPDLSYFGTNAGGPLNGPYDFYQGNLLKDKFQWMYAGVKGHDRVFYLLHLQNDKEDDILSFLGNEETGINSTDGMTVWGFGRDANTNPLLSGKQQFVIGFYPKSISELSQHNEFKNFLIRNYLSQK